MVPQIILVSNRLPVSVKKVSGKLEFQSSGGGLASGLSFYTSRRGTKWIGWPGIVSEELTEKDRKTIIRELAKQHCFPVFLTKRQVDRFYNDYSNSVIWPFFHNLKADIESYESSWKTYREVNQLFAEAVLSLSNPRSTIWVHDYQLMLMPSMLREQRPYDSIGFFLHIPFPEAKKYQKLPQAKSLLRGLLGADVVGFHTQSYTNNFLDTCHALGVGVVSDGHVALAERVVQVTDFPISIDYTKFADTTNTPGIKKEVRKLGRKYGQYKIILTVDRLDLTKGFLERLRAYKQLLKQNPQLHRKVIMLMLAVPSRTDIVAYQNLQRDVEALIDEINAGFGQKGWQPIVYMFKSVPFAELSALYQVADVAFITPLRDGMNLVAKEYVASQTNKNGVLILSETAGAAEELTEALLVNPRKPQAMVNALQDALTMTPTDLQQRLVKMQDHLANHTVQHWAGNFMRTLGSSKDVLTSPTKRFSKTDKTALLKQYKKSHMRLLLLDYDGVLSPFHAKPKDAVPSPDLLKLLKRIGTKPGNELVLVSGRSQADLDTWFGTLPIHLAAEHGSIIKHSGEAWPTSDFNAPWKQIVRPILEAQAAKTPGAFVEEKARSLVWHYRQSPAYYAQKNSVIIKSLLKPLLRTYGLGLYSGNNILEVKALGSTKGNAVIRWLPGKPDFIMAIGDDYTDEDMFRTLPSKAYTFKVGSGRTAARFRLSNIDAALELLEEL